MGGMRFQMQLIILAIFLQYFHASARNTVVGVDYFGVGNSVAVQYISPTGGDKVVIALLDNVGNRLINLGIRYYENVLVLNSLIGGNWGKAVRPKGFDFTAGTATIVSVTALEEEFEVLQDGRVIGSLPYRYIPVNSVMSAAYLPGTGHPRLEGIAILEA